jgi:hypothetical protein
MDFLSNFSPVISTGYWRAFGLFQLLAASGKEQTQCHDKKQDQHHESPEQ